LHTYSVAKALTLTVVVLGTALFVGQRKNHDQRDGGSTRLIITNVSGAYLESFFAGLPPNAMIADSLKNGVRRQASCGNGSTAFDRVGKILNIVPTVRAQSACGPNDSCTCVGCNHFAKSYVCGFNCDGGDYVYTDFDPMLSCSGTKLSDPRNCYGGCECGVATCYNGQSCGC
jgi:hypothetical protein